MWLCVVWESMLQAKGLLWEQGGMWGLMSISMCLEERCLGGRGSQSPGWSSLHHEGFLWPPLLSSIPDPTSNRKVWSDSISYQEQSAQGQSCWLRVEGSHCVAFFFDIPVLSWAVCVPSLLLCTWGWPSEDDIWAFVLSFLCKVQWVCDCVQSYRHSGLSVSCMTDVFGLIIKNAVGTWGCFQGHRRALFRQMRATRWMYPGWEHMLSHSVALSSALPRLPCVHPGADPHLTSLLPPTPALPLVPHYEPPSLWLPLCLYKLLKMSLDFIHRVRMTSSFPKVFLDLGSFYPVSIKNESPCYLHKEIDSSLKGSVLGAIWPANRSSV